MRIKNDTLKILWNLRFRMIRSLMRCARCILVHTTDYVRQPLPTSINTSYQTLVTSRHSLLRTSWMALIVSVQIQLEWTLVNSAVYADISVTSHRKWMLPEIWTLFWESTCLLVLVILLSSSHCSFLIMLKVRMPLLASIYYLPEDHLLPVWPLPTSIFSNSHVHTFTLAYFLDGFVSMLRAYKLRSLSR